MININKFNKLLSMNLKHNFYTKNISNIITNFYNKNTVFDKEASLPIALFYLDKYKSKNVIKEKDFNDIFISCLILSNKYITDFEIRYNHKFELKILENLNWNLFIKEKDYDYWNNSIKLII
jgi:hypothetical protein